MCGDLRIITLARKRITRRGNREDGFPGISLLKDVRVRLWARLWLSPLEKLWGRPSVRLWVGLCQSFHAARQSNFLIMKRFLTPEEDPV